MLTFGDEPEQGHDERVHQADEGSDRQRFAARYGVRPEDRVVPDRNSHEQQADERRRGGGYRGKVGIVRAGHHANRSWHGPICAVNRVDAGPDQDPHHRQLADAARTAADQT